MISKRIGRNGRALRSLGGMGNAVQRTERIGALLARAVARRCEREARETVIKGEPVLPENADPIVLHIAAVGECSPKDIRDYFSLKRTTAFRRLKKLVEAGELQQTGSTRNVRYKVAA